MESQAQSDSERPRWSAGRDGCHMAWRGSWLDLSHRRGIRVAHTLRTFAPLGHWCSSGRAPGFAGGGGAGGPRCSLACAAAAHAFEYWADSLLAQGVLLSCHPPRPADRAVTLGDRYSLPPASDHLAAPVGAHGGWACLDRNDATRRKSKRGKRESAILGKHERGC